MDYAKNGKFENKHLPKNMKITLLFMTIMDMLYSPRAQCRIVEAHTQENDV